MLEGSTRRGWDSVWGSFVPRMDHANVEVLVNSRMSSGKERAWWATDQPMAKPF